MLRRTLHAAVAHPRVYDRVQRLVGAAQIASRIAPYLADAAGQSVLDAGAGTGSLRAIVPASATYLWLDNDRQKLAGAAGPGLFVLGDATSIGLRDKSVDVGLCVAVSHHLTAVELPMLVAELARVVRRRIIFLDAVQSGGVGGLLWRYDRGSYPRSAETLCAALAVGFEAEHMEMFAIYHRYVLWVGRPREG